MTGIGDKVIPAVLGGWRSCQESEGARPDERAPGEQGQKEERKPVCRWCRRKMRLNTG